MEASMKNNLYQDAVQLVITDKKPSVSYLQRNLDVSYEDAVDLLNMMEQDGIVSPLDENRKRTVLYHDLPTVAEMQKISAEYAKHDQKILDKLPIVKFWRNAKFYNGTSILDGEYQELEKANLIISNTEIQNDSGRKKIHPNLQCEPYVGNLATAKCFILTLNPRAGIPYAQEYKNWQNKLLQKIAHDVTNQNHTAFPFYYLDPVLENTDGANWWLPKFGLKHVGKNIKVFNKSMPSNFVRRMIAETFCDIELCPYHSRDWNPKLEKLIIDGKLPSSTMAIEFVKHIIHDTDKHIFIRGKKGSGIAITLQKLIPELSQDLPNVHYTPNPRRFSLGQNSALGKILYREIFKSCLD